MRNILLLVVTMLFGCVAFVDVAHAESPSELETTGAEALSRSQTEPDAIIAAALFYSRASAGYEASGNETKAVEMNSYLYWCKKKMTLDQMNDFLVKGETHGKEIVEKLQSADKVENPNNAQTYYDRAEAFATSLPDEHLRIAIRYFEVADRFADSDIGKRAMRECLKQTMLASKSSKAAAAGNIDETAKQPKRLPLPSVADQKKAEAEIKSLFRDDLAKVKPGDKADFATRLSTQAEDTKDNPSGRYEMRVLAINQAAQAGDVELLLMMHDKLDADFEGDFKDVKRVSFSTLSSANRTPAIGKFAADCKLLLDHPNDLAANLSAGRFLCFGVGDFERGLQLLAKSNHSVLSKIAKEDVSNPVDGTAQVNLGNLWWDTSEKGSDVEEKRREQVRAGFWYSKALPGLSGLTKMKLEKRIEAATMSSPVANGVSASAGSKIDLLKLIDPNKDTVRGTWSVSGANLVSDKSPFGRIEIPYIPPDEYDFKIVFKRTDGKDCVCQILSKAGNQFCWIMGGFGDTASGLDVVNGKRYTENETLVTKKLLTNNQVHTSIVQVRKTGVTVLFDGKQLTKLSTTFGNMKLWTEFKLRNGAVLGLAQWDSSVEFSVVELIEISGTGKKTR